jgi:hypothetical protein
VGRRRQRALGPHRPGSGHDRPTRCGEASPLRSEPAVTPVYRARSVAVPSARRYLQRAVGLRKWCCLPRWLLTVGGVRTSRTPRRWLLNDGGSSAPPGPRHESREGSHARTRPPDDHATAWRPARRRPGRTTPGGGEGGHRSAYRPTHVAVRRGALLRPARRLSRERAPRAPCPGPATRHTPHGVWSARSSRHDHGPWRVRPVHGRADGAERRGVEQ